MTRVRGGGRGDMMGSSIVGQERMQGEGVGESYGEKPQRSRSHWLVDSQRKVFSRRGL